ncbi:MAG: hypothetical protein AB7V46_15240 [Thermomicrobiales bacterium]
MAITDAGQICESTALTTITRMTLSGNVPAGGLVALGMGGRVVSGYLDIVAIMDSQGNEWDWHGVSSGYRAAWVAWSRTGVPLQSGIDWIEVRWSKAPEVAWISGHAFNGAAGSPTERDVAQGSPTTTAAETVALAGSDDLVLSTVAYAYSVVNSTPLNSMTEQDTFDGGNVLLELLSRNVTSGPGSFAAGLSFSASRYWTVAVVSFPFEALPAGRSTIGMFGAV